MTGTPLAATPHLWKRSAPWTAQHAAHRALENANARFPHAPTGHHHVGQEESPGPRRRTRDLRPEAVVR